MIPWTDYHACFAAYELTRKTTNEIAEKLKTISSESIDWYLKKDKGALKLKGKSLTKPLDSLKNRPYTNLLHQ